MYARSATCKQYMYMIQDGKFLQSDFTFLSPDGAKSTGTGISGFDQKQNRFTAVWLRLTSGDNVDSSERRHVRRQKHRALGHRPAVGPTGYATTAAFSG